MRGIPKINDENWCISARFNMVYSMHVHKNDGMNTT